MPRQNGHASSSRQTLDEDEDLATIIQATQADVKPRTDDEHEIAAELAGWTIGTFKDQPLTAADLTSLREVKGTLQGTKSTIEQGNDLAIDVACTLETIKPDDDKQMDIQSGVRMALMAMFNVDCQINALDEIIDNIRQGSHLGATEPMDLEALFEASMKRRMEAVTEKSQRQRFGNNETFRKLIETVWEVHHTEACPPAASFIRRDEGDPDTDDEIEVGGTMQTFRCPLTMAVYVDACKSTSCGHYYSYNAIMDYIRKAPRGRAKCPEAGCNKPLHKDEIQRDPSMQQRAERQEARRKQREAAAESDDEELIE